MFFSNRTPKDVSDDGEQNCLKWTRNHSQLHHHTMMSYDVGLKKIRLILLQDFLVLLLGLGDPGLRWMFSEPDLLHRVLPFHLRFKIWTFHHSQTSTLPLRWVFLHRCQMRPSVLIPQCLRPTCLLSRFSPRATHIQGTHLARLLGRIEAVPTGSLAETGWYSTIASNEKTGPSNGTPNRLS